MAKGREWHKAKETWEGTPLFQGERVEAVQQVCFGADRSVRDVLDDKSQALALALHQPLLERRQEVKG
jgi:exodeoxyribonuclease V gamma subunit